MATWWPWPRRRSAAPPAPAPAPDSAYGLTARAYDAATLGRRGDWWARTSSANAEIIAAGTTLRARSRDLARNNPHAGRALTSLVNNAVGPGIQGRAAVPPSADTKAAREAAQNLNRRVDDLWWRWCEECDANEQLDFNGLQQLAVRSMLESGDVLVRRRPRRVGDGLTVPLVLQLLEADHLDDQKTEELRGPSGLVTGRVIQGVEFDPLDRRSAYWLYPQHPGDAVGLMGGALASRAVPAYEIAHIYEAQRPGQVRGVPWLTPVMLALRELADYQEAILVRAGAEACIAGVITSPEGPDGPAPGRTTNQTGAGGAPEVWTQLQPGSMLRLRPGEAASWNNPPASPGYDAFVAAKLREIAAGARVSYERMTADYSRVNFSSARAGDIEFRRTVRALQRTVIIRQLLDPVWRWFIEAAQVVGLLPRVEIPAVWTPPAFESVQPEADLKAIELEMDLALTSRREVITRLGRDPDDVNADIVRDKVDRQVHGIEIGAGKPPASPPPPATDETETAGAQ